MLDGAYRECPLQICVSQVSSAGTLKYKVQKANHGNARRRNRSRKLRLQNVVTTIPLLWEGSPTRSRIRLLV